MRPAEFSDLQGLIQGLSTGIQGELDKLASGMSGRLVRWRRAGRCGWRRGRCSWPGGRSCWPSWMPGWPGGDGAGPRVVALCGLGGAGKTSVAVEYAHRHLAEVGVAWQFAAEDPAVLAAGFGELAAQLGAAGLADAGTRWRRCTRCWPPARRRGCWCSTTRRTGRRWRRFVPPAGPGRVLITSQNQIWPPGQALEVPVLDPEVAAEFLVEPDRRPGPAGGPGAGRRAGRAAAGAGAGRRLHAGQRGQPGRVPGVVPAAARRTCWPAASRPGTARRWPPPGRWRSTDLQQAAPGAVGLLRLLAFCAPEAIPLRLLLQPRPGPGRAARRRRWRRCWCRCWRTRWRPVMRSRRCAGIR